MFAFRMGGYSSSTKGMASVAAAVDFDRLNERSQKIDATDKLFASSIEFGV